MLRNVEVARKRIYLNGNFIKKISGTRCLQFLCLCIFLNRFKLSDIRIGLTNAQVYSMDWTYSVWKSYIQKMTKNTLLRYILHSYAEM